MKAISFHPEVEHEIAGAYDWYERRRPGLGEKLLGAIDLAVERILEGPTAHPLVSTREDVAIRKALLARFPYAILYIELQTELRVVAFAHLRRKPGYWVRRMP